MPKPKSGIARYLSELRYRLIWAKESRHSSAAARSALAHPNNPTLEDVKTFLRTLTPRQCGKDLVRIGPDEDGGYLLPDDLDGIDAFFRLAYPKRWGSIWRSRNAASSVFWPMRR